MLARMRVRRRRLLMARAIRRLLAELYRMDVYRLLRQIGKDWGHQKDDLIALGLNIEDYARENLPLSRQWLDKHEELHKRWAEFLEAFQWATTLPWEPDRKPSLKKAMEMMEAYARFQKLAGVGLKASRRQSHVRTYCGVSLDSGHIAGRVSVWRCPCPSTHTAVELRRYLHTSPPYWRLRDYGDPSQIGLKSDPQHYIEELGAVFVNCGG